ncbi:unnamed protein product [Ambrosiozyma monospora]|uniref:Unnamed protein product n=1 Tax=Ambrosiozyma monospora TaxID=43982 RepID=A0A9W7DIB8_AMBMO|nr:unnamed protein product [Ambrosiozyma monospora]
MFIKLDETLPPPSHIVLNTTFTILCISLLILLLLGISLFYSGLTQRKSTFQQLGTPFITTAIIFPLWLCFGYTLCFSNSGPSHYLGNFENIGLRYLSSSIYVSPITNTNLTQIIQSTDDLANLSSPAATQGVLSLVHAVFQGFFACICCALALGCIVDRGRLFPCFIFVVCWLFLVYCPICYWIWNENGWIYKKLNVLDIAGGHVVHLVSGLTGFVYSWFLDYRSDKTLLYYRASNLGFVVIGTCMLISGWIGFNCGSLYAVNLLTVSALANTLNCSFIAGLSWFCLDYFMFGIKRISIVGFCSGCVAGLVAITPGTAFVPFWATFIIGNMSGVLCNLATRFKYWVKVDDALDIFAIHFIGGVIGNLLTGLFADKNIAKLGGIDIDGGWLNHNYIQLLDQFLSTLAVVAYTFFMSFVLLLIINKIPYCQLRVTPEEELKGMDESQIGSEYINDYIEFIREIDPSDYGIESQISKSD